MTKTVNFKTDEDDAVITEIEVDEEELDRLIEEECTATEATVDTNVDEGMMRIQMFGEDGLLASLVTDSAGAYEFARQILRGYDVLEGIR